MSLKLGLCLALTDSQISKQTLTQITQLFPFNPLVPKAPNSECQNYFLNKMFYFLHP